MGEKMQASGIRDKGRGLQDEFNLPSDHRESPGTKKRLSGINRQAFCLFKFNQADRSRLGGVNVGDLGDAIVRGERRSGFGFGIQAELHDVGVLFGIVEVTSQDADRFEVLLFEEQLAVQIPFTDLDDDLTTALLGELVDQPEHHLGSDALATSFRSDCEIQNMQPRLVQLINHEPENSMIVLSDHSDAVTLTEAAEKVFVVPGIL